MLSKLRLAARVAWRGTGVAVHLLIGLPLGASLGLISAFGIPSARVVAWWHRRLLRILNVELRQPGLGVATIATPSLVVCNHVSWLDIPVLGALLPARFVSKAEVGRWPIIGSLARAAGTEFHRRGGGGARLLTDRLVRRLTNGQNVIIFPEGTTTVGVEVRRFQPRLFAAAIEADTPVIPVALRYGPDAQAAMAAPYIGDDVFFPHLIRMMTVPRTVVDITVAEPIAASAGDRNAIAKQAHAVIAGLVADHPPPIPPTPSHARSDQASASMNRAGKAGTV